MFSQEELNKLVTERLNNNITIPNGHKGALFTYVDTSGVQFGAAVKNSNGWQIEGDIQFHPHQDGLKAGLSVVKTW